MGRPAAPLPLPLGQHQLERPVGGRRLSRPVDQHERLGGGEGSAQDRTRLARRIYRDHLACLVAMTGVTALQLLVR